MDVYDALLIIYLIISEMECDEFICSILQKQINQIKIAIETIKNIIIKYEKRTILNK